MLSLTSTGTELRRFRRGLLPKAAIAALILIPLLYGALYLWAFWDPTGRLDRLPVALVNSDVSATRDGVTVHAGDDVTEKLLQSGDLKWVQVDPATAEAGVKAGDYYFAVTIPASFSSDVVSAGGDDPTSARINVTYNDANSFLASTLGKSAMTQVRDAVAESIGQQQVDQVLVGLGSARDGFAQASDGAITLATASGQLASGAHQVADGASTAATGATSLASGAASLAKGASTLASGATTLDSGAATLATGAGQLAGGAHDAADSAATLASKTAEVAAGVHQTNTSVTALAGSLNTFASGLPGLVGYLQTRAAAGDSDATAQLTTLMANMSKLPTTEKTTAMLSGLSTLDTGASQLAAGAGALSTGLGTLSAKSADLAAGATSLTSGTSKVATGASQLAAGTATLSAGASDLSTGVQTLSSGAAQVADGTDKVTGGAQTLGTSLAAGTTAIPDDSSTVRTQRAATISDPVVLSNEHMTAAQGFGEGFAPFFLSLALFVGSLITWLLLRPVPTRALAGPASNLRVALAGYLPAAAIGVLQVAVMLTVIHVGLGLTMASAWGTVALTLLVAATFIALQQMLLALLGGAAGKVAILAVLMLQLASSGGTYPVETTPLFFRAIHPLLPMSYAVTGLRHTITGDLGAAALWQSVLVLVGVLIASLAVTVWRTGQLRTWTMARLHPALSL
ncbi:YhgE/Pip family protein [Cellulomonas citrea]|uniref:YhgE/Pip family protein n=1 Tax=Cellulomonas citrea TaxID=1909423 RepID=UPI00135C441A|nr:YhgE/Pip domain-containing protein [Cellulomonas citrea]